MRSVESEHNQFRNEKNEMISRRDDENVVYTTLRRSNKEISHFFVSPRAGEFGQASVLLVVAVGNTTASSSRLESCPNALR